MTPPPAVLARALEVAVAAAREAGGLLRADFHREGGPRGGGDKANADTEAEHVIRRQLTQAQVADPAVRSEPDSVLDEPVPRGSIARVHPALRMVGLTSRTGASTRCPR